jgi:hypothetical protein
MVKMIVLDILPDLPTFSPPFDSNPDDYRRMLLDAAQQQKQQQQQAARRAGY